MHPPVATARFRMAVKAPNVIGLSVKLRETFLGPKQPFSDYRKPCATSKAQKTL